MSLSWGRSKNAKCLTVTALMTSDYAGTSTTAEQCRQHGQQRAWPSLLMNKAIFKKVAETTTTSSFYKRQLKPLINIPLFFETSLR